MTEHLFDICFAIWDPKLERKKKSLGLCDLGVLSSCLILPKELFGASFSFFKSFFCMSLDFFNNFFFLDYLQDFINHEKNTYENKTSLL